MEAMILAAGAGTRLRPLTDHLPKALVPVGDRPLLGWVLQRLIDAGATRVIVNTHDFEAEIRDFLERVAPSDVEIAVSPEPGGPYDTGGGLFAAAPLFQREGPFLLHNVDVLSTIPLPYLLAIHGEADEREGTRPVASLAVQQRDARRSLLFDDLGLLGWENRGSDRAPEGTHRVRAPVGTITRWSFTGIHVIEPRVFDLSDRTGRFSIIDLYLDLARQGHRIAPIDVSAHQWIDVGTHERLAEARAGPFTPE